MTTQTNMAKATILRTWHNGAEDRTYNTDDLKTLTFDERDGGVLVEDDEHTVRSFFKDGIETLAPKGYNNTFVINGHAVSAFFDVQDLREPPTFPGQEPMGLGAVQVRVVLTIDGKGDFQLLLQNDNDETLELADREASQEELNGDVWAALGGCVNGGGEVGEGDWSDFVAALEPVIAAAQAEFDDYIKQPA